MAYAWSSDLETGNATIDSQHKQLIAAVNNLMEACSSGKGRAEVERTLKFLVDYTNKHFGDEEKLQLQYKFPDYPAHKKLHDGFKRKVADVVADYNKNGPSIAIVGRINGEIGGWLINHIKTQDVKVAAHIRNNS